MGKSAGIALGFSRTERPRHGHAAKTSAFAHDQCRMVGRGSDPVRRLPWLSEGREPGDVLALCVSEGLFRKTRPFPAPVSICGGRKRRDFPHDVGNNDSRTRWLVLRTEPVGSVAVPSSISRGLKEWSTPHPNETACTVAVPSSISRGLKGAFL